MATGTATAAHPDDLKARAELDQREFMGGIALFDEMLEQMSAIALQDVKYETNFWLEASLREGKPLVLHALPALSRLRDQPDAAVAGFAAALGDYLGLLIAGSCHTEGAMYKRIEFDNVWIDRSEPEAEPEPSNVVPLRRREGAAA